MSWLNSLAIWQWSLLAIVPPAIVLLYFLKLKRQPLEVPSTFLWARTVEDLHVNTIWQRLRQNLLLFLQLLLILLIILSLLRPGWEGTAKIDKRAIFVVDTSASMSATDVEGTRLDEAKRRVAQMIREMNSGDVAMIISVSDSANVEQPFTDNQSLLLRKLNAIKQTNHRSDIEQALRYAAGLANPGRTADDPGDTQVAQAMPATLYIYSDGRFPKFKNFFLGNLEPEYYPIGSAESDNLAVGSFRIDRNPEKFDQIQAFARIDNFGAEDVDTDVSLYIDGELRDAEQLNVPADGQASLQFNMDDIEQGELRLVIDRKDDLMIDNDAYVAANLPRRAKVLLITDFNAALSMALSTTGIEKYAEVSRISAEDLASDAALAAKYKQQSDAGAFDLIIFDRYSPEEMPQANTVFLGAVPPTEGWGFAEKKPRGIVIDSNRSHPVTQLMDMGNVNIADCYPVTCPAGGTRLVDADVGLLMAIAPRQGYEDLVVGFEMYSSDDAGEVVYNTDWQIRRSFPLFVMNMIKYLGGVRGSMSSLNVAPGEPAIVRSRLVVDEVRVKPPVGSQAKVGREGENAFVYTFTNELGVYQVREGSDDEVSQRFTVNLFDTRESNILPLDKIDLGESEVSGTAGVQRSRFELWKWILLLGFCVLVGEWYIYNQRVYL